MKFFGRIGFIFLSFFVFSCHNFLSEPENNSTTDSNLVKVSGSLTFEHGLESFFYKAQTDSRAVSKIDGKTITVLMQAERTVEASTETVSVGVDSTNYTYSVELPKDTWTFKIHMYFDEPSSITTDFNNTNYSLSAEKTVNVGTDNTTNLSIPCTLRTGENQIVRFDLNISEETNITQYSILIDSSETASESPIDFSSGSYSTSLTNDLTTGLHSLIIYFKDTNNNLIYSIEEKLFIIYGINSLTFDNNNENFLDDNGNVKITSQLIQNRHANKIYFVDSSVTDDSTRTGTFFDPVASIQKAVNIINSVNDASSQYEIRLKSDCTFTSNPPSTSGGYVDIKPNKNLKLKITTSDGSKKVITKTSSATTQKTFFKVEPSSNLTLDIENLIIQGGEENEGGGAFNINAVQALTISNCEFIENKAESSGGALWLGGNIVSCEITDCIFNNNKCIGASFGNGGAIYTYCQLTLNDCSFISNQANKTGPHNNLDYEGTGGAIVLDGNKDLIINGCTFKKNTANGYGGAIYLKGNAKSLVLNNVTTNPTLFEENYGSKGNAIYTSYPITINDNVYFLNTENTDTTLTDSHNDIYYNGSPSITINSTKTNDTAFTANAADDGYCYCTIDFSSKNQLTKYLTLSENTSLYKFIKVKDSLNKYFFTSEGKITLTPNANDLLKCPEGLNTDTSFIQISTAKDFSKLLSFYPDSTSTSKNNIYKQTANIDLSSDFSWISCFFKDIYDGQGYKIKNLNLSNDDSHAALFGTISGATLKNIILDSPVVNSTSITPGVTGGSALAHSMSNSKVLNCSVLNGQVTGKKYMSGLIGSVTDTTNPSYIINSSYEGIVTLNGSESNCTLGGILGYTNGAVQISIINCFYKGEIQNNNTSGIGLNPGGIAYSLSGKTIYNCYVSAKFTGTGNKGSFLVGSAGNAFNSYADSVSFTNSQIPEQLVSSSTTEAESYISQLQDDYLEGDLLFEGYTTDRIQFYVYSGSGTNFAKNSTLYPIYTISAALNKFVELNNAATNFTSSFCELKPWSYDSTNGIHFSEDNTPKEAKTIVFPALVADEPEPSSLGTTPIWIRNEKDFEAIDGWNQGNTIELKKDLLLDYNYEFYGIATTFSNTVSFTFNGNNHTITYDTSYYGIHDCKNISLFGYAKNLNINDLTVNADLYFYDTDLTGGVLVGMMKQGTIQNCICNVNDFVTYSDHPVKGLYFGGIVGQVERFFGPGDNTPIISEPVVIRNCEVKSKNNIEIKTGNDNNSVFIYGGIVGYLNNFSTITIDKCINNMRAIKTTSHITTQSIFGGIAGHILNSNVNIYNCINKQNMAPSTNSGGYSSPQVLIGGIVGYYGDYTGFTDADDSYSIVILNCINQLYTEGGTTAMGHCGIINSQFPEPPNMKIMNCVLQTAQTLVNNDSSAYTFYITNCKYNASNFKNNYYYPGYDRTTMYKDYNDDNCKIDTQSSPYIIVSSRQLLSTNLNQYIDSELTPTFGDIFVKWTNKTVSDYKLIFDE
ncbi:MAG: hypothetical protein J6X54_07015 [Treponema sp.]|nr:hypothetical protein [Treponema sp.]